MDRAALGLAEELFPRMGQTDHPGTLSMHEGGRTLGPTDIVMGAIWISPGSGDFGDGNRPDLGQENATAAIGAALRNGIREFDTAPWYGAGASEERLGRALQVLTQRGLTGADEALVVTKVGRLFREPDGTTPCVAGFDAAGRAKLAERVCKNDYSAAGAEVSLQESLVRLGQPGVFGLRVHDPNDNSLNRLGVEGFVDEVAQVLGEGGGEGEGMCAALRRLRAEGTVAHVGLGMNSNSEAHQGVPEEVIRLLREAPRGTFDSALLAGGWNLLSQAGLPCYVECERAGVAVYVAGVFASGLLVGGDTYAYQKAPPHLVERAQRWGALAARHGYSLPSVTAASSNPPSLSHTPPPPSPYPRPRPSPSPPSSRFPSPSSSTMDRASIASTPPPPLR